jgi:hypothetical protein
MMEFETNVRWLTPRYATILQPAEAGFACVDAVSNRRSFVRFFNPLPSGFVCVDAVSTAVRAMAYAPLRYDSSTCGGRFCLCRRGF